MKTKHTILALLLVAFAVQPFVADEKSDLIMFGGDASRNMVSNETNLPTKWNLKTGENIKWVAEVGSQTYAGPIFYDGRSGKAALAFDARIGGQTLTFQTGPEGVQEDPRDPERPRLESEEGVVEFSVRREGEKTDQAADGVLAAVQDALARC